MAFDSKGTLNRVTLVGRLGNEPELKYTTGGAAVLTLSVATTTSWREQDGSNHEATEWHTVVIWRKLAEIINQFAHKGDRILIEGRNVTRSWKDKHDSTHYKTEVYAESAQLLESNRTLKTSGPAQQGPQEVNEQPIENFGQTGDLPF